MKAFTPKDEADIATRHFAGTRHASLTRFVENKICREFVALPPAFVKLAADFGMVPQALAERVLAAFVKGKPRALSVAKRSGAALLRIKEAA